MITEAFDNRSPAIINPQMKENALKKAGVYEKVKSLPDGIHTVMTKEFDEHGAVFSGGESQKLAVARTFAKD